MRDIVAAVVPLWLIYFLFSVPPAMLAGYAIRKRKARIPYALIISPIAALVAAAIGVKVIVQRVVEPWLLPGIVVAQLNERLPRKIDNVSTWVWTQFRDETFIFFFQLDGPANILESFNVDRMKAESKQSICKILQSISEVGDFRKLETRFIIGNKEVKAIAYNKADCP